MPVTTHVKFGAFLAETPADLSAAALIGAKGTVQLAELPAVTASSVFAAVDANATAPLHLAEEHGSAPASVTVWATHDDKLIPVAFSQFAKETSRHMAIVRTDSVRDVANKVVPAKGNALLVVRVESAAQAYAAGLAVARNWPLYSRKTGAESTERTVYVDFVVADESAVDYDELNAVAAAIRDVQRRVDTPCSELNTVTYVEEVRALVERLDDPTVSIKVIQGEELKEQGFGGIYGVGKAAEFPPALVILSRVPENADKTLALVGKGIVYDSGGLSLKPTSGMVGMKGDMGGSAAVLGAFEAIVATKAAPETAVHALLCLAENAIDGKSFKNDDILHMYSGKTVEINNTDAEGRLVLADGVAYATQHLNPDVVIDMATLTGAQLITTGIIHAGIVTDSEEVETTVLKSGKATGDLVFPMLYAPEILKSQFDSPVADMKNSVKDRMNAQSSCAAHFVQAHLAKDYKGAWLHVDIAGPAEAASRGTGFGAALLYEFAKQF
ncbi:hypothetical protein AMAG_12014 [Allomyces macrogynus ATCC 38327]|uniref:Cytosol aminopeptidase domain-containing protein n=1 Tax=Allomyces macrogynus (strain ATCC 38327) TaxID=578462 RepID=A0A0L0SYI5_ALLM3|nr:hypothetical protein AMAG_12014 [Allomyces macrogynus ATCC 38327]|eukprot:KNE67562.1 hypothetical protein AMAG_12014 [Allomyces macrogynus ATCC 38327]